MTHLLLILLVTAGSMSFSSRQNEIHFSSAAEKSITITVFLGIDCPVSQKYITTLNSIYTSFKDRTEIEWIFIIPENVKKSKLKAFAKEYKIKFPLESSLTRKKSAAYYEATVTPEVFVEKKGRTLYKGAIDNWFYELGKYRQQVTENYLIDALESVLRNQEPIIKETTPVGCFIQHSKSRAHHHHE